MRVNEARQHGAATEINHLRGITLQFHHVRGGTGGNDAAILHRHRLDPRTGIINGQDRAARINGVSHLCREGGRRDQRQSGKRCTGGEVTTAKREHSGGPF